MDCKYKILIVEDEDRICNFISAILTANGFNVIKASNGNEAILMVASHCPDLILLDLGLPDIDGIDVLKTIRQWSDTSVIIISARGLEKEKVEALDSGADDYITKPFGTSELLARIRTAIRHNKQKIVPKEELEDVKLGELKIDISMRRVQVSDVEVHLTPIEFKIILLFVKHIGKVLTHDYIIKEIWGPYENDVQVLRVNMANIRRKIERNPAEPKYIVTEVGVGYRMIEGG